MNVTIQDTAVLRRINPYTVVIQYANARARVYISCLTLEAVRETIKRHRLIKAVKFIHYNIPELDYIVAYDARDPTRYV
jgi:hypothetical protein